MLIRPVPHLNSKKGGCAGCRASWDLLAGAEVHRREKYAAELAPHRPFDACSTHAQGVQLTIRFVHENEKKPLRKSSRYISRTGGEANTIDHSLSLPDLDCLRIG